MEIIRMSDLSIDDIEMVKKHIMRLYYHDDYEEWDEIGIIVGKDHPAFSEVEKISERSNKE